MTNSPDNDNDLLRLISNDDEDAFTRIYNKYWDKLYFLAHQHLKSHEAAEEIVQDVFLTLWKGRKRLKIENLPPYLAAMTRFSIYKQLAKDKKHQQKELTQADENKVSVEDERSIDNRFFLEIIEKASNQLPEKCRLVFIHNKLLDLPLADVAAHLNISVKTAEHHLTKALKTIRNKLGDDRSS